ncbi:ankyrin repeat-containing domain protein [Trichoderma chlorosporum]
MSNPNDYTVGWICAISTESVAARAFLDEEHDPPDAVSRHDNNVYTLGKMGKHNVVIAALPDGEYGISAAASVARDMLHSFPNVRIGLMVGIGGGVPTKNDIRLGDVVVSATQNGQNGVFQYDFGKTIQAQDFQNTMFLDQPPALLRSAVGGLKARYESDGHQFQETIDGILKKKPRLRKNYQRPDSKSDRLYLSNAIHSSTSEERCAAACGDSMLVPREQRVEGEDDPAIHYGLIASGNQLMKDALIRDQLASKKEILCFEMEAAGLMNHFPCLVIRGICDYSDSHKNKDWQGYAAMTAAAYAKDVIGQISPNKIEAENRISDVLTGIKQSVDQLISVHHAQKDIAILDWLTPIDYNTQQSDYFRRRQQGTGQWLLDSDQFQNWVNNQNEMLFCPGMPGAGKTVLTSLVVDHLHSRFQNDLTTGIAFFYFNYKRQDEQTIDDLMASLLKQLAKPQHPLPRVVKDLHNKHNSNRTRPSVDELTHAVHSMVREYSRVYIITDALDECRVSDNTRSDVLSGIFTLQSKTRVNVFVTSRFIAQITDRFCNVPTLEVKAKEEDIRQYLAGNIHHLPNFVRNNTSLQEEIITSILKVVGGMFLLAQLYLDSMKGKTTPNEITFALEKLATGSDAYEQIYSETMQRIVSQYKEQAQLARSVLSWVTCSMRPMTVNELRHALAIKPGESSFDTQNLTDTELMVSVCVGLVTIDNDSRIIRLVHYTTQEYLQRTHQRWLFISHAEIATTCLTYLSYQAFGLGECLDDRAFIMRLVLYPFYKYASHYWGHHAREGSVMGPEVLRYLNDKTRIAASYQVVSRFDVLQEQYSHSKAPEEITGLHIATLFGLTEVVALLLSKTDENDILTRIGWIEKLLPIAARHNHDSVVQLLLDIIDNIEAIYISSGGGNLLHLAVKYSQVAIIQLLLKKGINIEATNGRSETPLHSAATHGHESVVKLLLDEGANIEAINDNNKTPLFLAVEKKHISVAALLLDRGAKVNAKNSSGETCLHISAEYSYGDVVQLLLERGAIIESKDIGSNTPLHVAARQNHHEAIAQLLLDHGANIEASNDDHKTPLILASKLIDIMLSEGADIDAYDKNGETSLHAASSDCKVNIVELLLDKGANIEAANKNGETPLFVAIKKRRSGTVKLLLNRGANIEALDVSSMTPLFMALRQRDEFIFKILLHRGVNTEAADKYGKTPLLMAAEEGQVDFINLLLKYGADITTTSNRGLTHRPLKYQLDILDESEDDFENVTSSITRRGYLVELLLNNGAKAVVNNTDERGRTAVQVAYEQGYHHIVDIFRKHGALIPSYMEPEDLKRYAKKRPADTMTAGEEGRDYSKARVL